MALFMTIYAVSGTGGPIHVQIDDSNLNDEHLDYGLYEGWNATDGFYRQIPEPVASQVVAAATELIAILQSWPLEERHKFINYAHKVHSTVDYHWSRHGQN